MSEMKELYIWARQHVVELCDILASQLSIAELEAIETIVRVEMIERAIEDEINRSAALSEKADFGRVVEWDTAEKECLLEIYG